MSRKRVDEEIVHRLDVFRKEIPSSVLPRVVWWAGLPVPDAGPNAGLGSCSGRADRDRMFPASRNRGIYGNSSTPKPNYGANAPPNPRISAILAGRFAAWINFPFTENSSEFASLTPSEGTTDWPGILGHAYLGSPQQSSPRAARVSRCRPIGRSAITCAAPAPPARAAAAVR